MNEFMTAVVIAFVVVLPGVVVADLLSDAPRVARWLSRRAEELLLPHDRAFFGWVAEIEEASGEAVAGRRSRLSVLGAAMAMSVTAVRQRVRSRHVRSAVTWPESPNAVRIRFLMDDPDPGGFEAETASAEWIGEDDDGDLYEIKNHLWFTERACFGDIVRVDFVPIDDMPGYGTLDFSEVVTASDRDEVNLWNSWRIMPKRRLRRLLRHLNALEMDSEWQRPPSDVAPSLTDRPGLMRCGSCVDTV